MNKNSLVELIHYHKLQFTAKYKIYKRPRNVINATFNSVYMLFCFDERVIEHEKIVIILKLY